MTPKDVIRSTINMSHEVMTTYVNDLSDEDLMVRVVPGANHAAWQLGHLIASEHEIMTQAGFSMPDLPEGFLESYTKETSGSDDAAKFHTKEQYLAWAAHQRAGTMAALESVAETDLSKPAPESMREYAPTIGVAFNVIGVHIMMHASQLVPLRRKLDKPVLI